MKPKGGQMRNEEYMGKKDKYNERLLGLVLLPFLDKTLRRALVVEGVTFGACVEHSLIYCLYRLLRSRAGSAISGREVSRQLHIQRQLAKKNTPSLFRGDQGGH